MNRHGWHTAEALPEILAGLRAKGFTLATVSELGGMINATRESINKHLKLLAENGLVEQGKGGELLVRPGKLRELAEQGSARVWAAWKKR